MNKEIMPNIQSKIFKIRGKQIILDSDLAKLYEVPTKQLNQAVKRNIERFPERFMFQLTENEKNELVTICDHLQNLKFSYQNPYVFTEQGVSMWKFLSKKQGIFYDGQIFDAYNFVSDLIKTAKQSIILIDNYVDDSVLTLFTKNDVKTIIYTKNITKQLQLDLKKYNSQYKEIIIKQFNKSHDRFLIIDNKEVYHFGASLKDLGKKWFAFSKLNINSFQIISKVQNEN